MNTELRTKRLIITSIVVGISMILSSCTHTRHTSIRYLKHSLDECEDSHRVISNGYWHIIQKQKVVIDSLTQELKKINNRP